MARFEFLAGLAFAGICVFLAQDAAAYPNDASLTCLGCHDGSVAPMVTPGAHDRSGFMPSMNHPVGVDYRAARVHSRSLRDPSSPTVLGHTIETDLLTDGQVECTSCHALDHAGLGSDFLLMSNDGSALCLTCHDK